MPGVGLEPTRIAPTDFKAHPLANELLNTFLESRKEGLSQETIEFYKGYLTRSGSLLLPQTTGQEISSFINPLTLEVAVNMPTIVFCEFTLTDCIVIVLV